MTCAADGCLLGNGEWVCATWERPIMEQFVALVPERAEVVEIGLGLGVSGRLIAARAGRHVISERDPSVIETLCPARELIARTILSEGVAYLSSLAADSVDVIFCDDWCESCHNSIVEREPFWSEARRVVRMGGRVVCPFYANLATRFAPSGLRRVEVQKYVLRPGCEHVDSALDMSIGYWEKL